MKKNVTGLLLVATCLMIIIGGCASNEVVKKEESIAPTTKAVQVKAEPAKVAPVKPNPTKDQPAKQALAKGNETVVPAQNAGNINAALEKIYFDFDSYALSSDARNALKKNMEFIKINSKISVRIEGNCDERGSAEYNLALGEKRAKAAMQYLVTLGIPENRLSVISYGKERPAVQGNDELAWSKNRRDEFVIQK